MHLKTLLFGLFLITVIFVIGSESASTKAPKRTGSKVATKKTTIQKTTDHSRRRPQDDDDNDDDDVAETRTRRTRPTRTTAEPRTPYTRRTRAPTEPRTRPSRTPYTRRTRATTEPRTRPSRTPYSRSTTSRRTTTEENSIDDESLNELKTTKTPLWKKYGNQENVDAIKDKIHHSTTTTEGSVPNEEPTFEPTAESNPEAPNETQPEEVSQPPEGTTESGYTDQDPESVGEDSNGETPQI